MPLSDSSFAVSSAVQELSSCLSHQTCASAYMPFTPNNSEQRSQLTCYRGCWHVISRCLFMTYRHQKAFLSPSLFFSHKRTLQPSGLLRPRGVAPSGFPPLRNILSCCLPQESGPYLSPNVPVHPLRPGNYHCLGGPLPHQLANSTRAAPPAVQKNLSCHASDTRHRIRYYPVFPQAVPVRRVRHPRVTHQSAALGKKQAPSLPPDLHA